MNDPRSDAELLDALRDGDGDAYVALWNRHVGAALRYAGRLYPSRAEDLVSESFLAVYQQVTTTSKGPAFAFRSYLKAVMRNTSIRWRKESEPLIDTEHVDRVDSRDALTLIERESDAADLLGAFQELPERWQRVLWLSEVAAVPRPDIARELGIEPNAVSALHRRARSGLKLRWLERQVPAALQDDTAHVARLLPRYLTDAAPSQLSTEVDAHVSECAVCADILANMRGSALRLQTTALSAVGFGALGTAIPAVAPLAGGSAAAAAIAVTGVTGVTALTLSGILAAGIGALTVGGLIVAITAGALAPPVPQTEPVQDVASVAVPTAPLPSPPAPLPARTAGPPTAEIDAPPGEPRTGRHNDDPSIESVDLVIDPALLPTPPVRPQPAGPNVPGPGQTTGEPTPQPSPGGGTTEPVSPAPGVLTASESTGYLAPVIRGQATSGSSVAVQIDGTRYAPEVATDGTWSFDPRGLELPAGTHEYQVWAYDSVISSPVTTGTLTVLPIVVSGFEELTGFEDMMVSEAQTTGVVIAATGPANGTIFVTSMEGHSALIPLDETGHTVKRLRMNSYGWYYFTFRALDADGYWGPPVEEAVDVYDPDIIFDPWGPSAEDMTFDFVDP
ncbi:MULTISPECIES: sigma-70 family RNA polymerase sigma factor [unclassified Microbacterium]|uniref:sigma-70 family RNA polymerase sigma factor n=1 Tax=unclassified Microbacterium TaxID=2609290 RepID=UPI0012FC3DA8|nr:sigma-70 family RNA polymerase sigma factor [Microbacterium sp. MAH-37]MVQ42666.1 sigma-70 family RNA polymerase sigma factor [Microbacterium sp. MAH-37]